MNDGVRSLRPMGTAMRLLPSHERRASPDPAEPFEPWLQHRVAHAVEAGEVSVDFLSDLLGELEAAPEKPPAEGYAQSIQSLVEIEGMSPERAEEMLSTLESQPMVARELLMRRIAETWLEGQRKVCRPGRGTGGD